MLLYTILHQKLANISVERHHLLLRKYAIFSRLAIYTNCIYSSYEIKFIQRTTIFGLFFTINFVLRPGR